MASLSHYPERLRSRSPHPSIHSRSHSPFPTSHSPYIPNLPLDPSPVVQSNHEMNGYWAPHTRSPSAAAVAFDDVYYNPDAYDHSLYGTHYRAEDAYADLLEFEEALRFAADISESERLRRWHDRLAFEELAEVERLRRYEQMAEDDRLRLGLIGKSWWARRYAAARRHSPALLGGWRSHYGERLRRWTGNRLPLSSSLLSRFERIWLRPSTPSAAARRRRLSSVGSRTGVLLNTSLEALELEQIRLTDQLRAVREEARLRELELEQTRRRLETEFAIEQEGEIERQRAETAFLAQKIRREQRERELELQRQRAETLYLAQKAQQEREMHEREILERERLELERQRIERDLERQRVERDLERQRAEASIVAQKVRHEQHEREVLERSRIEQELYREDLLRWENDRTRLEVERKRRENEQLRLEVANNVHAQEHERRLRRELDLAGRGIFY